MVSWSTFLIDFLPKYDMITYAYWTITAERMSAGAFSPYGFQDNSYVLITAREQAKTGASWANIFQFSTPFNGGVWALSAMMVFVTGFFVWFFEAGKDEDDFGPRPPCS